MKTPKNTELTSLQKAAANRKLAEAMIVSKIWEDDAFAAKLENDPTSALTEVGFSIPEGKTLRIIEEKPGTIHIILPPKPECSDGICDEDLAAVAGGKSKSYNSYPWRSVEEIYRKQAAGGGSI